MNNLDAINHQQWLRHPYSQLKIAELEERYKTGCWNLILKCNNGASTETELRCLGGELKAIKQLLESLKAPINAEQQTTNNKQ